MPLRAVFGALGSAWVIVGTAAWLVRQFRDPARRAALSAERIGMVLAHLGVGVFVLGVMLVEATGIEKDVRMKPGDSVELGAYRVRMDKIDHYEGPNYVADRGHFTLLKGDVEQTKLEPEKRLYSGGGQAMTESAIAPGITRDVYLALGEPLGKDGAWAVRAYLKPFVRCIWIGAVMMLIGGLVAATDRRLRARSTVGAAAPATATVTA
jgi:cytochrome c-type biogenesis protein CcmF